MKNKILNFCLIILTLFISQLVIAQGKWGWVKVTHYNKDYSVKEFYLTEIIDVTKLDCSSISKKNSYGTEKSKLDYYWECAVKWFKEKLKVYDLDEKYLDGYLFQSRFCEPYAGCPLGNEVNCFYSSKNDAIRLYKDWNEESSDRKLGKFIIVK